jgi:DNA-binding HxlR family transcriptional regulator
VAIAAPRRLARLGQSGILEKTAYPAVPPRVEYRFTPCGEKILGVPDGIDALQREIEPWRGTRAAQSCLNRCA